MILLKITSKLRNISRNSSWRVVVRVLMNISHWNIFLILLLDDIYIAKSVMPFLVATGMNGSNLGD